MKTFARQFSGYNLFTTLHAHSKTVMVLPSCGCLCGTGILAVANQGGVYSALPWRCGYYLRLATKQGPGGFLGLCNFPYKWSYWSNLAIVPKQMLSILTLSASSYKQLCISQWWMYVLWLRLRWECMLEQTTQASNPVCRGSRKARQ